MLGYVDFIAGLGSRGVVPVLCLRSFSKPSNGLLTAQ